MTSDQLIPTSDFRLPNSDFRLPTSEFLLPTPDLLEGNKNIVADTAIAADGGGDTDGAGSVEEYLLTGEQLR